MFEYMAQSELDTVPSPRILNTHLTLKLVYQHYLMVLFERSDEQNGIWAKCYYRSNNVSVCM